MRGNYSFLVVLTSLLIIASNVSCSEKKSSKPKKRQQDDYGRYGNQDPNVPPYSYQQNQAASPYGSQGTASGNQGNNGNQYGAGGSTPGLYGGQGYTPTNSNFSLQSVLGLLSKFLGIGNGTNTPFSFLSATVSGSSPDKVRAGISFFNDEHCRNGITTLPAGQPERYYSSACSAFAGHTVGAVGLNGQCQSLSQGVKFYNLCRAIVQAEIIN